MNEQFEESSAAPCELVVLIDTSQSMEQDAQAISQAAGKALEEVKKECGNVKVHWFGIEGEFSGTSFTQSLRNYLTTDNKNEPIDDRMLASRRYNPRNVPGSRDFKEDGAYAIKDIANHFKWDQGAARAILFLGDEELCGGNYHPVKRPKGGTPQQPKDITETNDAINAAIGNGVSVSMYAASKVPAIPSTEHELMKNEYRRVANETGGQFHEVGTSQCSINKGLAKFVKALRPRTQDLPTVRAAISNSCGRTLSNRAEIKRQIRSNWNATAPNMKFWWIDDGPDKYTIEVEYTGRKVNKVDIYYADRPKKEQFQELLREVICDQCKPDEVVHPTDLVMVIYATDSMAEQDVGPEFLNNECLAATMANQNQYPGALRVEWLGIEGGWESRPVGDRIIDTDFWPSYRSYLVGSPNTVINDREDDRLVGIRRERGAGAAAITDLSNYFDWRTGAAKYIFLFGNKWLGDIKVEGEVLKGTDKRPMNFAIETAENNGVTVFTCCTCAEDDPDCLNIIGHYREVAEQTGGKYYAPTASGTIGIAANEVDLSTFQDDLEIIVRTGELQEGGDEIV